MEIAELTQIQTKKQQIEQQIEFERNNVSLLLQNIIEAENNKLSDNSNMKKSMRKIFFEFKEYDTNNTLLLNINQAYESALNSQRLYAFWWKEHFFNQYAKFQNDLCEIEEMLIVTTVDKYEAITILEEELDNNKDAIHALTKLKSILKELSWFWYYS